MGRTPIAHTTEGLMYHQSLRQKRLFTANSAILALAVLICSPSCFADEAQTTVEQPAKAKSPRTIIIEEAPKAAPYKPPLRLSSGASARGWLGRMPKRRKTTKPANELPPPAPLLDPAEPLLFPIPVPPASIRRQPESSVDVNPKVLPKATTANELRKSVRLPRRTGASALAPLVGDSGTLPAVSTKRTASLRVKSISEATEPPAVPNAEEPSGSKTQTTPEAQATPLLKVAPQDDDAKTNSKPAAKPSAIERLMNARPLQTVSLSRSIESVSLDGDALNQPEDQAGQYYDSFGVYHELPAVRRGRSHHRNSYPICFNPLYFEDPNLERCGLGYGCFTEFASAIRFFGRVPLVPYMIGAAPPCSCVRSLGDCPTCHSFGCNAYLPPPSLKGTALQTAATVGLIFLLP